jgi:hypothetical protein
MNLEEEKTLKIAADTNKSSYTVLILSIDDETRKGKVPRTDEEYHKGSGEGKNLTITNHMNQFAK